MTCKDYLNIPMQDNDAGAKTIGGYLKKLLLTLWNEKECFSSKRPFGNSGWEYEIYQALISAKVVDGKLDECGYVDEVDYFTADGIIRLIIISLFDRMKGGESDA